MICTYRDFAAEEEVDTTASALQEAKLDPVGDSPEQVVFPVKLHTMLGQVEKEGLGHVVGWAPHGRCFMVRNKDEFVTRILARWFRQSKFASFQRQLNLYGFKRITTGPDKGGYYHELFLRGKVFLCQRIERVKIKGSKPGRIKAYADAEPDFYRMRPLPADESKDDDQAAVVPLRQAPPPLHPPAHAQPQPLPIMARPPQQVLAVPGNAHNAGSVRHVGGAAVAGGHVGPRSLPEIRPIERNLSFHDFGRGDISFISGQPQPMPLARNSPPAVRNSPLAGIANEERKQQQSPPLDGEDAVTDAVASPNNSSASRMAGIHIFPTNSTASSSKDLDMISGRGPFSLLPDTNALMPSSAASSAGGPTTIAGGAANTNNALGSLPTDHLASSSAFSTVHPVLQASGRTNLVNLRDSNAGLFGVGGGQLFPSLPTSLGSSSQQQPQQQGQPLPQVQQQQHQQQQPGQQLQQQQQPLPSTAVEAMDLFDMPSEMLSQYLPTAQALALADLFGGAPASASAATATATANPSTMTGTGTGIAASTGTTSGVAAESILSGQTIPGQGGPQQQQQQQLLPLLLPAPPQPQPAVAQGEQTAMQMPGQWQDPGDAAHAHAGSEMREDVIADRASSDPAQRAPGDDDDEDPSNCTQQ